MDGNAYSVPEAAIEERFLAATGPGGQNVNKVATAVQLRLDVLALGLEPDVYRRLKALAGNRWAGEGEIVIVARNYRTREANRNDARARIAEMVSRAHLRPVKRIGTKPGKGAKEKRLVGKAIRGDVKKARGKVRFDV